MKRCPHRCMHCNRKYIPEPKLQGYRASLQKRASELCVDVGNLRRISRQLKVQHRTVALWVSDHAEALPAAPLPSEVKEAQMDELFTIQIIRLT